MPRNIFKNFNSVWAKIMNYTFQWWLIHFKLERMSLLYDDFHWYSPPNRVGGNLRCRLSIFIIQAHIMFILEYVAPLISLKFETINMIYLMALISSNVSFQWIYTKHAHTNRFWQSVKWVVEFEIVTSEWAKSSVSMADSRCNCVSIYSIHLAHPKANFGTRKSYFFYNI